MRVFAERVSAGDVRPRQDGVDLGMPARVRLRVRRGAARAHAGREAGQMAPNRGRAGVGVLRQRRSRLGGGSRRRRLELRASRLGKGGGARQHGLERGVRGARARKPRHRRPQDGHLLGRQEHRRVGRERCGSRRSTSVFRSRSEVSSFCFFSLFGFWFRFAARRARQKRLFGRWSDGRVGRAPDAPGSTYLPARSNCGLGSSSRQNCNRGVTYLWTSRIFAGDTGDVQNAFRSSRSAEGGSFSLLAISSAHLFLLSPPTRAFPRSKKKTNAPKQPARPAWPSRRQPRSRAATTARRFRSPGGPRGSSRRAAATTACGATAPAARRRRGGKSARRRRRTPTT